MNKYLLILILIFTTQLHTGKDNFDPSVAEKSLVRVIVSANGKAGVCTGFLWKKTNWIVTSLHAMKPDGEIEIVYSGGITRYAKIRSVFAAADLVLLELKEGQDEPPANTQTLSSYQPKVQFDETIYAIGFNGGSRGNQTQKLYKGHANPENLINLVRSDDVSSVKAIGIPEASFPIYFLSGSLLPGFSGSPVYNNNGELIGIGDGGLERGQMNVSWCIPASNLATLEKSTENTLPPNFQKASLHYSADVQISVNESTGSPQPTNLSELEAQIDKKYKSFGKGDIEFYQTKNRSWKQMKTSSLDPYVMDSFTEEFRRDEIYVDTEVLFYDIYEDINHGFVIAIPEETQLEYDEDHKMFSANMYELPFGEFFGLYYASAQNHGDPTATLIEEYKTGMGGPYNRLETDPSYSSTISINSEWKIDYRLLQVEDVEVELYFEDGPEWVPVDIMVYMSVVYNQTSAFYSLAECHVPHDEKGVVEGFEKGANCLENYEDNEDACDFFESWIQVFAAAHLTTKSSLY